MENKKISPHKNKLYEKYIKRLLDFIFSLIAFIVLSPVLLIIAILVRINLGSPVIFKQQRPGLNGKIFSIYKFRTMIDKCDKNGKLLPDGKRLTRFGKKLRSTSLDELLELWNIMCGDCSFVGPRPLMPSYLEYYTEEENHRHDVRPGLTGLAQINGRSFISWEEIFSYDLEYVANVTFLNDLRIVWQTIWKVIGHKNIADVTKSTADKEGKIHLIENGKDVILHQPLNVERKDKVYAEGNR